MNKKLCKQMKKRGKWKPIMCEMCSYAPKCKEKGGK